jgi:EmrB/QacA subfamily drug resistance transporter
MPAGIVEANKYRFFTVGAIGTFMATLDGSIVGVALPTIADELHCGVDVVAWVILAYSLTLISLMLVFGAWTESKGYAFAYRFGYILFLGGSILCAMSWSIYALIASRVIQAVGSAMFAAIGPGMVSTVFPPEERGKGLGLMVMMVAGGFMIGPPLGGFMLQVWPWRSIFMVNIPVALVGLSLVFRYFKLLPAHSSTRKVRLPGAFAIAAGLVAGILGLTLLNDYSFTNPRVLGLFVTSATGLAVFFVVESKPHLALIGLHIFKNRQFTTSILAQLTHFVASSGVFIMVPFYLQRVKGFEPRQVGMYLIILPVLMFIFSPLAGKLSDRIGFRVLTTLGMLITAGGLYLLSGFDVGTTNGYVILSLVVIGMGVGSFNTPNSSALMGSVGDSQRAVASGIMATNRNIGTSVGIGLATGLFAYFEKVNSGIGDAKLLFVSSYRPVVWIGAGLALVGVIFCLARGERASSQSC